MMSFNLNYLFKDSISKYSPIVGKNMELRGFNLVHKVCKQPYWGQALTQELVRDVEALHPATVAEAMVYELLGSEVTIGLEA